MGSAFAPSTANLLMDKFEQLHILNPQSNPNFEHVSHYYRYIDNIFYVYNDPPSYPAFQNWLNQLHPTIEFTFSGDEKQVNFLDTAVFRTPHDSLALKPFKKPTDKNSYLHYRSFYPRVLRQNIPYGQFARLRRNSTFVCDYFTQSASMKKDFLDRGYPESLISDAARRADRVERCELLKYKQKDTSGFTGIMAALDFTPLTSKIKQIDTRHWHLVRDFPGCNKPPRWELRKTKCIKDVLTRSDIRECQQPIPVTVGHHKCGYCSCCAQSWETKEIHLPSINFHKRLEFFSSCSTRMCVYLIICKCNYCYVGSTRRRLKVRITEHKSRIRNAIPDAPMVQHFLDRRHSPEDFKFVVLEIVSLTADKGDDVFKKLMQQEPFWIFKLQTLHPRGLNTHMDLSVFF